MTRPPLRETKVVAALCDGLEDLTAKRVVGFILGKVQLCANSISIHSWRS